MEYKDIQGDLDKVRDFIIERGWHKGSYVGADGGVCLGMAIFCTQVRKGDKEQSIGNEVVRRLHETGCTIPTESGIISQWNDYYSRTLDDVLTILSDKWEELKP